MSRMAPSIAGCTVTTAHTETRTHTHTQSQAGHHVPTKPLMDIHNNNDEIKGTYDNFIHT